MKGTLLTIRECAKAGIGNENLIRELVRDGKCPGIWRGNRFYVNVELLKERINEYSMEVIQNERSNK